MTAETNRLPPELIGSLIRTALQAHKRGDRAAAHALLRKLVAHAPDDARIWLALATVAATRDEQRQALEHVIAINPAHPLAQRSLARFADLEARIGMQPHTTAASPAPPIERAAAAPPYVEEQEERPIRWPLYVVLGSAVGIVLLAYVLLRLVPPAPAATPTPVLAAGLGATAPSVVSATAPSVATTSTLATQPASAPLAPTADTLPAPTAADAASAVVATIVPPEPSLPLVPTPEAVLQPGEIVTAGEWYASLLRPDYAIALDGNIGDLQPQGRFVLALMMVANNGTAAARMPENLFTLIDSAGNPYRALPSASTAYLSAYGRAQRGDFSMEDEIPAGGRNVSVPVVFDVPLDARTLTLRVGDAATGWLVTLP